MHLRSLVFGFHYLFISERDIISMCMHRHKFLYTVFIVQGIALTFRMTNLKLLYLKKQERARYP